MIRTSLLLCVLLSLASPLVGQSGDRKGEVQADLPEGLVVPAAPALTPQEQLSTFTLAPGFRVELVAAEPLVNDPVAAEFDERGRLWVVEMTGYMPDVDGRNESDPVGSIAILHDDDGDGGMDRRTVFMDELVLPRSVHPVLDGALVILPGEVLFCRDLDGDGRADESTLVDTYRGGVHSPEHALNGFVRTLDNWYRCANGTVKYRPVDGRWEKAPTTGGGQWGITQDDEGRVFYNTNPHPLRGDLFPSVYSLRNPSSGKLSGMNVLVSPDLATWPSRITPGVNRGYRQGTLRDDFTLAKFTAACGPHIYRGSALGSDVRGDAFIPEPSGNLVKRFSIRTKGELGLVAENVYEGREFWTSTDERFRPVNAFGGPDGALYVVDLYRGIIQHRVFVTTFLRKQILERGLDRPLGLGRIWRVVPDDFRRPEPVDMSDWSWARLVDALDSPDGWIRDTAQRVIVEEWDEDPDALSMLRERALGAETALGRVHALWCLAGVDGWTRELLVSAVSDPDARVSRAAMRVAEPYLSTGRAEIRQAVLGAARNSDPRSRHQAMLSLGAVRTADGDEALAVLATINVSSPELRSAVLSGLHGRELGFLRRLLERREWTENAAGRPELLRMLSRAIVREGLAERVESLIGSAAAEGDTWRSRALLKGMLEGRGPGRDGVPAMIRISREPPAAIELSGRESDGGMATELLGALHWPGKPGLPEEEVVRPLTDPEAARFEQGRAIYGAICATCHQDSGRGEAGKAPPLFHSEWVLGSEQRLVRILLQGMHGPLEIQGQTWNLEMPAYSAPDQDVAAVLTYIRREWGHGAEPVTPETVAAIRKASATRPGPWTVEELRTIPSEGLPR